MTIFLTSGYYEMHILTGNFLCHPGDGESAAIQNQLMLSMGRVI